MDSLKRLKTGITVADIWRELKLGFSRYSFTSSGLRTAANPA
jgi:hypothetical protein